MRFRRRAKVTQYWTGNSQNVTLGSTGITASSIGTPAGFLIQCWNGPASFGVNGPVFDALQNDVRLERLIVRVAWDITGGDVGSLVRIFAGVAMVPVTIDRLGAVSLDRGSNEQDYTLDGLNAEQPVVLSRRWLWWRTWVMAPPTSGRQYASNTTSGVFTSALESPHVDVKPRIRLQLDPMSRKLWVPCYMLWYGNMGTTASSLQVTNLAWRALYRLGAMPRR